MHIGIEAQRIFRPKKHGMDMVALELIKNLQQIDTKNKYTIFVQDDTDSSCLVDSDQVKIVKSKSSPYPVWEQIYLPKAVKEHKVDLLHCTSNTAPLQLNVPLVLTLHDIIYLEKLNLTQGTAYQKFGNLYRRWNVPKVVKKAKKIITVSNFENERIVGFFKLNQNLVDTVYNGVGNHFKRIDDVNILNEIKLKYNLPDYFVFFLGNTDPKKNVKGVLAALSLLRKNNQLNFKLVMLDINKEYLQNIAKQIGDLEVLNHIHFTGYVANVDLPAIYSQAQLFLYPSLRESFGIPLLEAMACGVPVITSNTSSMPEIASNAAIIVNPFNAEDLAQAINFALNNLNKLDQNIKNGYKRVKDFSWQSNAKQTMSIYSTILNNL